ncbi:SnoaL-like protein [Aminobacter aminovorans]|uniref:SnoaL-like domain n=1 Tax=Aminobacter aminovorans TaxID=83263 RepID=A0A380WQW7_AMIAI|nr:nuclear transport factor 2 family protein [Aminobacter aminovorans]TCS29857.1 SnoaL-like protein [Aminobacter aminovorans]SUU90706.1 SnoaL-like domain [Aminobacter aminovorans]
MKLPQAIQAYFEADRMNDREALLACFTSSAAVHDEGRSHSGHDAIGNWWEYAKAMYRHVADPLEALTDEHGTKVIARVTGEFPGSPANLTYVFRLVGDKIAALEIGA